MCCYSRSTSSPHAQMRLTATADARCCSSCDDPRDATPPPAATAASADAPLCARAAQPAALRCCSASLSPLNGIGMPLPVEACRTALALRFGRPERLPLCETGSEENTNEPLMTVEAARTLLLPRRMSRPSSDGAARPVTLTSLQGRDSQRDAGDPVRASCGGSCSPLTQSRPCGGTCTCAQDE